LSNLSWTTEYDVIDIYDEATNTWSIDSLSNAIIEHAVVAVEDKLIVAGGENDSDGLVSTVSIYTCPTSCLPEGITFSTQEQIDNFQVNYPYCTEIEGDVEIDGDDITNVDGLSILTSIGGYLDISDNPILTSLAGLINLTSIGEELIIKNNAVLSSLAGLDSINPGSISELQITDNENLATCHVTSICEYLVGSNPIIEIENNAPGCNSLPELQTACFPYVQELSSKNTFSISPNPCAGSTILQFVISEQGMVNCELLNVSGVETKTLLCEKKNPGTYEVEIDLKDLKPGIYFCVLKTNERTQTRKLINVE